jgi:CheY-like chemotaxis protein
VTAQEIVDAAIRLAAIVLSWPVVVVLTAYLLRRPLRGAITGLAERITRIEGPGGIKIDLAEASVRALRETVSDASREFSDAGELSEYVQRQLDKWIEVGAELPESVSLAGRTILWVDDRPTNNAYESHLLAEMGARITNALSTEQGLAHLERNHVDLVISDMHRIENGQENRHAGRDLAVEMERRDWQTPVLFYTGRAVRTSGLRYVIGGEREPGKLVAAAARVLTAGART